MGVERRGARIKMDRICPDALKIPVGRDLKDFKAAADRLEGMPRPPRSTTAVIPRNGRGLGFTPSRHSPAFTRTEA